jgi:ribosomal protein L7/L12
MIGFFLQHGRMNALESRLGRLERKLDAVLDHLGIKYEEKLSSRVRESLQKGDKIGAIKAYREETGAGLAEAKEAVERLG